MLLLGLSWKTKERGSYTTILKILGELFDMKSVFQKYSYFASIVGLALVLSVILPHQTVTAQNTTSSYVLKMGKGSGYLFPSAGLQFDLPNGWTATALDPYALMISAKATDLAHQEFIAITIANVSSYVPPNVTTFAAGCKLSSPSPVKVNGMDALQRGLECPKGGSQVYTFATQNKAIIVAFNAAPATVFHNDLPQLQEFLNTLKIAGTVNPAAVLKNG